MCFLSFLWTTTVEQPVLQGLLYMAHRRHSLPSASMSRRRCVRTRTGLLQVQLRFQKWILRRKRSASYSKSPRLNRLRRRPDCGENDQKGIPQGLKPIDFIGLIGTSEVVP